MLFQLWLGYRALDRRCPGFDSQWRSRFWLVISIIDKFLLILEYNIINLIQFCENYFFEVESFLWIFTTCISFFVFKRKVFNIVKWNSILWPCFFWSGIDLEHHSSNQIINSDHCWHAFMQNFVINSVCDVLFIEKC